MNRIVDIIVDIIVICILTLFIFKVDAWCSAVESEEETVVAPKQFTDWDYLIQALIQVESGGNDKAVNPKSKASGCLQLMPCYVKEINRRYGTGYELDDRFDRKKSIEMFTLYQGQYNPKKSISKAIYLHNPNGGDEYRAKVMREYRKLKNKNI